MFDRKPRMNIALRVAVIYGVIGGIWILVSDWLVYALIREPLLRYYVETFKGWFYVLATAALLYLLISRSIKQLTDVTDALETSEERLSRTLETMTDGVTIVDANGRITFANAAAERILGLRRDEITGRLYCSPEWRITAVDGGPFPQEMLPFSQVMATGKPVYGVEHAIERDDGTRVILSINGAPLVSQGRVTGMVSTFRDVTDVKKAELANRERRRRELQVRRELEAAKRQFYKGTIYAVTGGKLNLVTFAEIENALTSNTAEIQIQNAGDLTKLRQIAKEAAASLGMSEERLYDFEVAVGEIAANAIKHAGEGVAEVGIKGEVAQVMIKDTGPGIDSLVLPHVTLLKGFSTARSMGLGYSLVLASVDSVYLATGKRGTSVLLEKQAQEPTPDIDLSELPDTW